jgi:hypothetical protein
VVVSSGGDSLFCVWVPRLCFVVLFSGVVCMGDWFTLRDSGDSGDFGEKCSHPKLREVFCLGVFLPGLSGS